MSLSDSQQKFSVMMAQLILFIHSRGHGVTFGDAYRDPRVHGEFGESEGYGHPKSNHKRRLAVDLNLFKDGKFLVTSEAHSQFGQYWEFLHPCNRWGGRYDDANHYEHIPEGWR